ncbi:MAG: hypothetical protein M3256_08025 [Actinomycetota bacterium]|nr:hypothetical protein [Actinomycetota bacterium]
MSAGTNSRTTTHSSIGPDQARSWSDPTRGWRGPSGTPGAVIVRRWISQMIGGVGYRTVAWLPTSRRLLALGAKKLGVAGVRGD